MCPYKFYLNCHLTCTTVNHQSSNFSLPLHFSPLLYFLSHIHVSYVYTVPPQIDPARTLHSSSCPCIYLNITSTSTCSVLECIVQLRILVVLLADICYVT